MKSCPCKNKILTPVAWSADKAIFFINNINLDMKKHNVSIGCRPILRPKANFRTPVSLSTIMPDTSTNAGEVANQTILAGSCNSRDKHYGAQVPAEVLCPSHQSDNRGVVDKSNGNLRLPPPETFQRGTRRSKVESPSITACFAENPVPLSMDEFILETVMDVRKFSHNQPVNYCLLRILNVPSRKK